MVGETFDVYGILAEQCLDLATLDGKYATWPTLCLHPRQPAVKPSTRAAASICTQRTKHGLQMLRQRRSAWTDRAHPCANDLICMIRDTIGGGIKEEVRILER